MFNQSCGCQSSCPNMGTGCQNAGNTMMNTCGCGCNNMNSCNNMNGCDSVNGCPRPQPLVAPRRVCVTNQVTPVPQPVICPIECRRVNRCMYYPVFYPRYEQTFMTVPFNQSC